MALIASSIFTLTSSTTPAAARSVSMPNGRARRGAGALRADMQAAALVDPGEGAAAGTDGVDVQGGQGDVAAADAGTSGVLGAAVRRQGHVAAGSAHVEGDDVRRADEAA